MKNGSKRGLFHPNDIKTIGLSPVPPGPKSAPLFDLPIPKTRPSITPLAPKLGSSASGPARTHARSASLAGSFGRAEAARVTSNPSEFDKFAEDDDEDYEDVFGKLSNAGEYFLLRF